MTTNNKGLGRGLGALISLFDEDMESVASNKPAPNAHAPNGAAPNSARDASRPAQNSPPAGSSQTAPTSQGATEIDVALIDSNQNQPRKNFNENEMAELEQSIKHNGVLQPILLNRVGTRFMIVAGERRWRAAKAVGLKTIPAIVRDYSPRQIAEIALVENLLRADLNEIEIANGVRRLMDTYALTQEQISIVLGKPRSAIANSLRYLELPAEVQRLLEKGKITAGHAKCLCSLKNPAEAVRLAQNCANGTMTVRSLERYVAFAVNGIKLKQILPNDGKPDPNAAEIRAFENALTHKFATKVSVRGNIFAGKIVITYQSVRDLERIREAILK